MSLSMLKREFESSNQKFREGFSKRFKADDVIILSEAIGQDALIYTLSSYA